MMHHKRWFTLLEILIVITILWVLFLLLLRTYNSITSLVFRVQQEKEVSQQVLYISQVIQNFADRNTIDYDAYFLSGDHHLLVQHLGVTDTLYLSGQDGRFSLFTRGDCMDPALPYTWASVHTWCTLFMQQSWALTEIISPKTLKLSKVIFKIIPFASERQYLESDTLCVQWPYIQCLNTPGFWMLFTAYSTNYGTQRATHVSLPFQQFF